MSDRLTDLQRQRALAQEQLDWIDREIAKETGQAHLPPAAPPTPVVARIGSPTLLTAADEIIAQYRKPATTAVQDAKRGCLLYFVFALGLLAILVVSAYYLYRNFKP